MRVLVQRVREARVEVGGTTLGRTRPGPAALLLVGIGHDDDLANVDAMARKVVALRIFADEAGRMNRSLLDVGGSALVVSQFTLYADVWRGNRPGFSGAADPAHADALYQAFARAVDATGVPTETGAFGADMQVHLVNDGPVTIWLDDRRKDVSP